MTDDETLARIARSVRDWGRDCYCAGGENNTCGVRFGQQFGTLPFGYDHKYVYSHIGYNLKVTDMQAAIGCAQLTRLDDFIARRATNHARLLEILRPYEGRLILPQATPHAEPSWFAFVIMEAKMAQTALDLSPQQWQLYRPSQLIEASDPEQTKRLQRRRQQAWRIARQAANLLRDQYGAVRVIAFGSLVHDDWFTLWSDIDLAAWGIPPDRFYSAIAAVTGLNSAFRIDLVDPDSCRPALRRTMEREGVAL